METSSERRRRRRASRNRIFKRFRDAIIKAFWTYIMPLLGSGDGGCVAETEAGDSQKSEGKHAEWNRHRFSRRRGREQDIDMVDGSTQTAGEQLLTFITKEKDAPMPRRATAEAVGWDVFAHSDLTIDAWTCLTVDLGFSVVPPVGHYVRINPRSGLALNHGIQCHNGIVDPDYRDDVKALLINQTAFSRFIPKGKAICQLTLEKLNTCKRVVIRNGVQETECLTDLPKRTGGFGSTG